MKNITAQELSRWNKFRDKTNISRKINEGISSSYQDEMNKLRDVDDQVREEAMALKPSLSGATTALKQRRYLDLFHFADEINKTLSKMTENLGQLSDSNKKHMNEFYGESEYYDPSKEFSFASMESQMLKEAGVFSSLFGSERQRAGKALETMYKKKIQKQKLAMNKLSKNLNVIVNTTIASLKQMAGFRTSGKLAEYIESLEKIELSRKKLSEELKSLYNTYIKDIVAYKKEHSKIEEAAKTESRSGSRSAPEDDTGEYEIGDNPSVELSPEAVDPTPERRLKPAEQAAQEIIEFENANPAPQEGQYYPAPDEDEDEGGDEDGDVDATDGTIKEYEQKFEPREITKADRAQLFPNSPPNNWKRSEWDMFLKDLDRALDPDFVPKPRDQAEWNILSEQILHGETDLWRKHYGYKKIP
jgi:hypothetical protein